MILTIFLGVLTLFSMYYYLCSDNHFTVPQERYPQTQFEEVQTDNITQSSRRGPAQARSLSPIHQGINVTDSSRELYDQEEELGAASQENYRLAIEKWEAPHRDSLDEINLKNRFQQYHPITFSNVCYYKETLCCYEYIFYNFLVGGQYINVIKNEKDVEKIETKCCRRIYICNINAVQHRSTRRNYPPSSIYFAKYFQLNPMKYVKIPNVAWVYEGYEHVLYEDYEYKTLRDTICDSDAIYFITDFYRLYYAKHLLLAINALHKRQIVIGNLSPDTIIIDSNDNVKIRDFSLAVKLDAGYSISYGCLLPLDTSSPEYLNGINSPRKQNDWWAYGIVLYYMYTGQYPFKSEDESYIKCSRILFNNIQTHNPPIMFESIPQDAKDLIEKLLKYNRNERIIKEDGNMEEIINHPYFIGSGLREELKKDFYSQ